VAEKIKTGRSISESAAIHQDKQSPAIWRHQENGEHFATQEILAGARGNDAAAFPERH
jgi:hypothetical protein